MSRFLLFSLVFAVIFSSSTSATLKYENCDCKLNDKIRVNLFVQNFIKVPKFSSFAEFFQTDSTFTIERHLEEAADLNPAFMFSATYNPRLGFIINSMNRQLATYELDKTYWDLQVNNKSISMGISKYVPKDGDNILFNFTRSS